MKPRNTKTRKTTTKTRKTKEKIRNTKNEKTRKKLLMFSSFESNNNNKFDDIDTEKQLIKMFKTPFTPTKYRSQDDYYTYINYQWLETTKKQIQKEKKYYVQVDSFRVTQEKVYWELIDIVKEYIKHNDSKKAKSIKVVYESLLNLDNASAEKFAKYYLDLTEQRIKSGNIYEILGGQNQNEIISWGCPIVWSVLKDEKNTKIYKSTISAPQLTIYDYEIYIEDTKDDQDTKKYKKEFKRQFLKYIDDVFDACLGKNHGYKSSDVWDCEYEILSALGCDTIKNDNEDGYNIVSASDALNKYGFDWYKMAKKIGYKEPDIPDTFICSSLNYLKCIMDTLLLDNAWQQNKWKTYFLYIIYRQLIRFHSEWRYIHYDFHEKFVKGQPIPYPKEIYPIFGLSLCFNTFLTNEYIRKYKNEQYIEYTENMAKDLLTVYKRIIKRNDWLSPSTKRYALKKLENIKLEVGQPELLREDPLLSYDSKEAFQNLIKMAHWRTRKLIQLDGKSSNVDIPVIDWEEFKMVGKQSYIVNAYYTPTENSIYVPMAYLQKPFIDLEERGIEYNLAHIGYTLGHEMSHCLDDLGSKYDENGNLHNWWTDSDRRKFNKKVNNVIKQYEQFAAFDGIKMDASLSTGENLADISGLAICVEYLRDFQEKNKDIVPIKALSFHAFFVYIAIQARQKIFDKAIKAQLKTNPHPMDKYRTNCPLARLELFRSLYNIKKGDKMYWESSDTIW
jgi:putative endopeptidase